jgi:hypothetical protein
VPKAIALGDDRSPLLRNVGGGRVTRKGPLQRTTPEHDRAVEKPRSSTRPSSSALPEVRSRGLQMAQDVSRIRAHGLPVEYAI